MVDRPQGRSTGQRLCLVAASVVLGTVGWFLMGETESLTAAETPENKVMARVDGEVITEEQVQRAAAAALEELEQQRRDVLAEALRREVESRLLTAEATRLGVSEEELLEGEVERRLAALTEDEIERFAVLLGDSANVEEARRRLEEQTREAAYRDLVNQLMHSGRIELEVDGTVLPPERLAAGADRLAQLPS